MFFCEHPTLDVWSPEFSTSGLASPSPTWTRAKCEGIELCNSLEWTGWTTNPIQVQICDTCGTAGCASGGYVHLSALRDVVLWTTPRRETAVAFDGKLFPASSVARFGAITFPESVWTSFRAAAVEVPDTKALTRSDGQSICDAWINGPARAPNHDSVVDWLRVRLLAADTLDALAAIQSVEQWIGWFRERARVEIDGSILPVQSAGAVIEKFYFDGPGAEDWLALAHYNGTLVPALGDAYMFVPGP
jgi:hypothetical protein